MTAFHRYGLGEIQNKLEREDCGVDHSDMASWNGCQQRQAYRRGGKESRGGWGWFPLHTGVHFYVNQDASPYLKPFMITHCIHDKTWNSHHGLWGHTWFSLCPFTVTFPLDLFALTMMDLFHFCKCKSSSYTVFLQRLLLLPEMLSPCLFCLANSCSFIRFWLMYPCYKEDHTGHCPASFIVNTTCCCCC